jgi:NDP-sugar pyrophosphorylase family protein
MKAVILAGGKGTRLRPYTTIFPKPLVPIGERPIVDIVVQQLSFYGFDDIVLSVGHLAELIQAYFYSRRTEYPSVKISYVREEQALGTAGPLKLVPNLEDAPFLAMNGDVLTTLNYKKMMDFHRQSGSMLTLGVYKKRVKIDLGVVATDVTGRVVGFSEKPEQSFPVSIGINIYSPEVLNYIEPNEYLDFPALVCRLLEHGERVMSYIFDGYWLDIGNQNDYMKAQDEFAELKEQFLPSNCSYSQVTQ